MSLAVLGRLAGLALAHLKSGHDQVEELLAAVETVRPGIVRRFCRRRQRGCERAWLQRAAIGWIWSGRRWLHRGLLGQWGLTPCVGQCRLTS
jgi:hypothetical protein